MNSTWKTILAVSGGALLIVAVRFGAGCLAFVLDDSPPDLSSTKHYAGVVEFDYPVNWEVSVESRGEDGVELQHITAQGSLCSAIITWTNSDKPVTADELVDRLRSGLVSVSNEARTKFEDELVGKKIEGVRLEMDAELLGWKTRRFMEVRVVRLDEATVGTSANCSVENEPTYAPAFDLINDSLRVRP